MRVSPISFFSSEIIKIKNLEKIVLFGDFFLVKEPTV